ncbi:MAG: YetF domain-containing protein [Acidobacteriota bacterium]
MHWSDLWIPGEPILAKILRPLVVYAFLVISLRLAGKRELAQLNPFDLVVLLTLSNTVQNAIIGNDNSITGGIIGAISLLVANYAVVRFLYRHERLDRLIEGDPVVLINDGRLQEDSCTAELVTHAELEAAAHKQGFASLDEVERAVLEPGGVLALFGRKPDLETMRMDELVARLDAIQRQIAELRR